MLTEIQCKNATCAEGKARARFVDSGGLYLEVSASGSKRWFWKYRFDGKEKRLSLGGYPATKLKEARMARDEAKRLYHEGVVRASAASWIGLLLASVRPPPTRR